MINQYKPNEPLNYVVIGCLGIQCILYLISIVIGFAQIATPELSIEAEDGSELSIWMLAQSLVIVARAGIYVLTIILFLVWLYRAHRNLFALRPTYLKFTPGWAVGWWFIPFANLVRPFQVMREVWWESDPNIPQDQMFLTESLHSAPTYMGVWWALWISGNVLWNILDRVFNPEDISTTAITGYFLVFAGMLTASAALFLMYAIYDISRRQTARFQMALAEFDNTPQT